MALYFPTVTKQIEQKINSLYFGENPPELYEPLRYLMQLGGKRIRPLLTILGYYTFQDDWERVVTPAVGVEVFHNFTLMHDDIMDNAPLRRGKVTVHEKWDANTAILSGDVMLVKAYELFADVESQYFKKVFTLFNQCATEVCEGQQKDMNFETQEEVSEADYLDMIRQKTSVLLGFALQTGAILAGADLENEILIRDFGIAMGLGFQIKDDLLDVYGETETFGKQVGGDIISNKKTFLLINAQKRAEGNLKIELEKWLSLTTFNPSEKVKIVTQIYNQLGIKEVTEQKIQSYFDKAFTCLEKMTLAPEKRILLTEFAQMIMQRQK